MKGLIKSPLLQICLHWKNDIIICQTGSVSQVFCKIQIMSLYMYVRDVIESIFCVTYFPYPQPLCIGLCPDQIHTPAGGGGATATSTPSPPFLEVVGS